MPPPAAERGSATVTLAAAAAVLLLLLAVIAGAVGGITGQEASACTAQPAASSAAAAIPANYLADFKKAGTTYGIPWTVLAAIGEVESGFGANDGPSSAGALGPMQFEPSTWAAYGDGGNIMNPDDAIPAAARLLVAHGAPGNLQQAHLRLQPLRWLRHQRPVLGRPLRRRGRPGRLRRRQRRVPAGRPRPAARRAPPGRSSPTPRPSSASPTYSGRPGRTPSTARAWP